jgi:hypothetical protein
MSGDKERPRWNGTGRQPGQVVNQQYRRHQCTCTPEAATDLLDDYTEQALNADRSALLMLSTLVQHLLDAERREGVR